jgi:hypothetical protein
VTVVLATGTWQKLSWISRKHALVSQAQSALTAASSADRLSAELAVKYEMVRPVVVRQRETFDALATLALLQRARSNQSFWYVLFATRREYFLARPYPTTNDAAFPLPPGPTPTVTKDGFVVELCVPEAGEAARRVVGQLVTELKRSPLFRNVDSLPDDRRRMLADPAVVLADGHFALELDLAENPYGVPAPAPERPPGGATRVPTAMPVESRVAEPGGGG